MKASIMAAERSHVDWIAPRMRQADVDECWAWSQQNPEAALLSSLASSPLAWTGMLGDEPVCMFGVGAEYLLQPAGSPWLLGTHRIEDVPVLFARMSRVALGRMAAAFPVLVNCSDARHVQAHAWLRWLGFTLGTARPAGALGMPFVPFWMETRHV